VGGQPPGHRPEMEAITIISVVFLVLIFAGIPVAYSMVLTSGAYFLLLNPGVPPTIVSQRAITQISESWTILAVPLFLLAGRLLNDSGMTARLVDFAVAVVGHIRGGLGHAVVVANIIMAGMSGSATSDAAGIGAIMIPALRKAGFSASYAAALCASAATIGPIIPPSIAMVLYSSLSGVSLGRLLLAGVLPGLVMGLLLMVDLSFLTESVRSTRSRFEWRRVAATARDAVLALVMPVVILGGMFGGIYTPTEAAAVAVGYALLVGVGIYRTLTLRVIFRALKDVGTTTGAVLLVVSGASSISWIMTAERSGEVLQPLFLPFRSSASLTLVIIALVTVILGTAMEEVTMLVLMTPILAPIVQAAGIDPVHFGLVFVLATMIGLITPPVGVSMFLVCQIADITVNQFTRAVIRPLLALMLALIVVSLWGDLVLFLPNLIMGPSGGR
jgi:C4-dicarboxylate transporter, DctM subunit